MKVALIGAMPEEILYLRERLEHVDVRTIADIEITIGTFNSIKIYLCQSGIGKVNAAVATAIMALNFGCDCFINTGTAAGLDSQLDIGDIVVADELRYCDVDVEIFDYEFGQVPRMPAYYKPDSELHDLAMECAHKVTDQQVISGLIASGDSFLADPEQVAFIKEKFPNICAIEMEACAIAQACYKFAKPFVIIRAVSDVGDKDAHIDHDKFTHLASKTSAKLVLAMLEKFTV